MKKKVWGNATWYLFHTLAEKLKTEYSSELPILFSYINDICNNLPCPDCQKHAMSVMQRANKLLITSSRENLINFLWSFHNSVNKRAGSTEFSKESLELYKRARTNAIIQNFINIMSENLRNEKALLNSFHRQIIMKKFIQYINSNIYKYNP